MKKILFLSIACLTLSGTFAQTKYFTTKSGYTSFDAGTGVEDITAINKSTTTVIDPTSGAIQFSMLIKGFEFKSQLMQDHFNENYMESEKFPKSTFKGNITNIKKVNFSKDGNYPVTVKGTLELHGVKNEVETTGMIKVAGESVIATADFSILLADYKIPVPSVVGEKLSKSAKIKLNCTYSVLNK
jgi:hypothetical protein